MLLAGVPVIATLLHVFGVYDMTTEQQAALTKTLEWAGVLAVGLFGADAGLRAARSHATAKVQAAAQAPTLPPDPEEFSAPPQPVAVDPAANGEAPLPTDDEEFADQDPDEDPGPDSRLQAVAHEGELL